MMKNKKITSFVFLFFFIGFFLIKSSFSFVESNCNYTSKITQCLKAGKNGSTRAIEEFVCINGSREEITYQIVFDEKFGEIDDEAEQYLQNLEDDKDKFFGPNAIKNYLNAVDEVINKFSYYGEYWDRYNKLCGISLINEVLSCQNDTTSIINSSDYFKKSECMNLANVKIYIYEQAAYDILKLNKSQVRQDFAKKYVHEERTKYDKLIESSFINIGYMEEISQKWTAKLKNTYK